MLKPDFLIDGLKGVCNRVSTFEENVSGFIRNKENRIRASNQVPRAIAENHVTGKYAEFFVSQYLNADEPDTEYYKHGNSDWTDIYHGTEKISVKACQLNYLSLRKNPYAKKISWVFENIDKLREDTFYGVIIQHFESYIECELVIVCKLADVAQLLKAPLKKSLHTKRVLYLEDIIAHELKQEREDIQWYEGNRV